MFKILCVLGKSGCGKSTLTKELCKDEKFHFVKSYTTRKPRENDPEDIETHTFVTEDFFDKSKNKFAVYENVEFGYHSWTDETSFKKDKINVYTIDVDAFVSLRRHKNIDFFGIHLTISEEERKKRYQSRIIKKIFPKDMHLSSEYMFLKCTNSNLNNYVLIDANKKTPSELKDEVMKIIKDKNLYEDC